MAVVYEKWIIGGATREEMILLQQDMTKPKEDLPEVPVALLTQIKSIALRISTLVKHHTGSERESLLVLDLSEALLNALSHGNDSDPAKEVRVTLIMQETELGIYLLLHVDDKGTELFSVQAKISEALLPENIKRPNGRGLLLMQHFGYIVQDPILLPDDAGKRMTITKVIPRKIEEAAAAQS